MAIVNLERLWETLRPAEGRNETVYFHDTGAGRGYSALALKVRANGRRSWFFEYRNAERKLQRRTYSEARDYREAERHRLMDLTAIAHGHDPAADARAEREQREPSRRHTPTVGDLIDNYLAHGLGTRRKDHLPHRPNYVAKVKRRMGLFREAWGSKQVAEIQPRDITAFFDGYADRPGMQTELWSFARMMFRFAKGRGEIERNPMEGLDSRGHAQRRKRYLNDEELKLVLPAMQNAGYPNGAVLHIALLTARRINEITNAEWSEIDLERGLWRLPGDGRPGAAKNHQDHELPLSPSALAIFRDAAARKVGEGRYVFHRPGIDRPIEIGSTPARRALAQCRQAAMPATERREAAQRGQWTQHDLRRSAAHHLRELGCPVDLITAILNQSLEALIGVTATYLPGSRVEAMREWLGRLDTHYRSLVPLALPAPSGA